MSAAAQPGFDFAKAYDQALNPSGEGLTSAGGPLANGMSGQLAAWLQQNPWIRNIFSAGKGALTNKDNPLLGALMGYAGSSIPGTGGPFSNALGFGSGLFSLGQGIDTNRRMKSVISQLDQIGDPYAGLRSQAMARLAALETDPAGALGNLPGYKAGMDAIMRQRAGMGQLGSGNLATALLDYGGNIYNQERNNAMNMLSAMGDPRQVALAKAQMARSLGAGNQDIFNGLSTLAFGLGRLGL
jgi:hypothetical protein